MNKTNIIEANKHLQALHRRVQDLERAVKEQNDLLGSKDYFIQTKIKELSAQDLIIQELQQRLQDRNGVIEKLTSDLSVKNLENATLREKAKLLDSLLESVPDLNRVVKQMDAIALKVKDLQNYGYIEVSASSSTADDGDDTSPPNFTKSEISSELILKTKPVKDDDMMDLEITNGGPSVREMARNFANNGRIQKFSVSEEDGNSEEESNRNLPSKINKEVYF